MDVRDIQGVFDKGGVGGITGFDFFGGGGAQTPLFLSRTPLFW